MMGMLLNYVIIGILLGVYYLLFLSRPVTTQRLYKDIRNEAWIKNINNINS